MPNEEKIKQQEADKAAEAAIANQTHETKSAARENTEAEHRMDDAQAKYEKTLESSKADLKQAKSALEQMEKNMPNAEEEAAKQGQPIGFHDALKYVDAESEAKQAKRQAAAKYIGKSVEQLGYTIEGGLVNAGVVSEETANAFGEAVSSNGMKALAFGMVGAVVTGGSPGEAFTNWMQGYLDLDQNNKLEDGVEEKSIDDVQGAENFLQGAVDAYMHSDSVGDEEREYWEENKELPWKDDPNEYERPEDLMKTDGDIFGYSENEVNDMIKEMAENAGKENDWGEDAIKEYSNNLLSGVKEFDAIADKAEDTVGKYNGSMYSLLKAVQKGMDEKDSDKEADGPDASK